MHFLKLKMGCDIKINVNFGYSKNGYSSVLFTKIKFWLKPHPLFKKIGKYVYMCLS